jgi:hypothetical protein
MASLRNLAVGILRLHGAHNIAAALSSSTKRMSAFRRGLSISPLPVCLLGDHPSKEEAMRYVLLIYHGTSLTTPRPEDERKRIYAEWAAVNKTPEFTGGVPLGLPENATTVRVQDGKTLTTDGPFVELKDAIGGYGVLEADDLDAAIELASRIPPARLGGAIEIRPSETYW